MVLCRVLRLSQCKQALDTMVSMAAKIQAAAAANPGEGGAPNMAAVVRTRRGGGVEGGAAPSSLLLTPTRFLCPLSFCPRQASEVMKTITPEQLATMSEAAGMKLSGDQAAALTAQMQKVSPETMAKLIAVGTFVSRAVARARDARDWAKRNPGAVAAGVLLLAAWWLRRRLGRAAAQPTLRAPVAAQPVPGAAFSHSIGLEEEEF